MKVAGTGIPFAETVVSLEATDFKERIVKMSGADKVPVLLDGDVRVFLVVSARRRDPGGRFRP